MRTSPQTQRLVKRFTGFRKIWAIVVGHGVLAQEKERTLSHRNAILLALPRIRAILQQQFDKSNLNKSANMLN
jgi:hypothetical protein